MTTSTTSTSGTSAVDAVEVEELRLARLRRLDVLDVRATPEQRDLARLATLVASMPVAATVLVDDGRVIPLAGQGCEPQVGPRSGSLADRVVRNAMPVVLRDVQDVDRARDPLLAVLGGRQVVAVPLLDEGVALGALVVAAPWPEPLDPSAVLGLELLAGRVVADLELRRTRVELALQLGARALQRRDDELTGLPSRRALYERAAVEFARHRRHGVDLAVVVLQVERADATGWPADERDDLLAQRVAHVLREGKRTADVVARWSGGRFVLVAPDTPPDAVPRLVERMRELASHVRVDGGRTRARVAAVSAGPGAEDFPSALDAAVGRLTAPVPLVGGSGG